MRAEYVTVPKFAHLTGKFTNQIYLLAKDGNSFRKLKTKRLAGRLMVLSKEVTEFPFNEVDDLKNQFEQRIRTLEEQTALLEIKLSNLPSENKLT